MGTPALVCLFIIILVVEAAIEGARRGVLSIASPVIALILALSVAGTGNLVLGDFTEKISQPAYESAKYITEEIIKNYTRESQILPEYDEDDSMKTIFDIENSFADELKEDLKQDKSDIARNVVAFIIIYALSGIAVKILIEVLGRGFIISIPDRVLGIIAGALISVIKMWFFMMLLTYLSAFAPPAAELHEKLLASSLYSYIYMMNPFL
ncbi:MAG: CvpA family protein [Butyrivibrio sp.]|uniref:CvpA family protein n=1 Tax=Butyrivibrio sp. TaxID=28121 RepID=UPI001B69F887|nr:CvpA family protein [Butyrivibrio sp.]MBP3783880.1 CvpA family protein [Butyrivibrio sp.]